MKKYLLPFIASCVIPLLHSFNIPKFYRGRIFLDEPRFAQNGLFTTDMTFGGGTKHFCARGYQGHFEFAELILQFYQNFNKGFFFHAQLPFGWIRMDDIKRFDPAAPPLPHCIKKAAIYSPGLFGGWTINYEDTSHLDFIDATCEVGVLLNSPSSAVNVPLFPIGYTRKPGFATSASCALGALEWLTVGTYAQVIVFLPATIWSAGSYLKLDHLVPRISAIIVFCGDGQNKKIESINPWRMFSLYIGGEVDLATDDRPWLPRFKAFFSKPLAGYNILKAGMVGFGVGVDAQIIF